MNNFSLARTAMELLQINEVFSYNLDNPRTSRIGDFEMVAFQQCWGNTSGGFENFGGSAMTNQMTYVFIPVSCEEDCQVYFGGKFAYKAQLSKELMEDVRDRNIKGVSRKHLYKSN